MNAPTYIPPVRPIRRPAAFDDPQWIFDLKYDGYRGQYIRHGSASYFMSKNGNRLGTRYFRELANRLKDCLQTQDVVFDGEIVSLDPSGRPLFERMLRHEGPFTYIVFDVMWLNKKDLRNIPLRERKRILHEFARVDSTACIRLALSEERKGRLLFDTVCQYDLEGVVAKNGNSTYAPNTHWYKILNPNYSQKTRQRALASSR